MVSFPSVVGKHLMGVFDHLPVLALFNFDLQLRGPFDALLEALSSYCFREWPMISLAVRRFTHSS